MKHNLSKINSLLLKIKGLDISCYEETFIRKSLEKRLLVTQINTLDDYYAYLEKDYSEAEALFNSMNVTYSEFFRNPLTFDYLEQITLPLIVNKKKNGSDKEIRVWSAACSGGHEVYSIAILLDEIFLTLKSNIASYIFATDINPEELNNAEKGIYYANSLNKVTLRRINTYFTQQGETYTIIPRLRMNINFSKFDLLTEKSFYPEASIYGNFDLVFCSNILFYFKPDFRGKILEKLEYSVASGGYLVCGETERAMIDKNKFQEASLYSSVFQKKDLN
jgi:chemotaxis methyl-accepting protein methylase